ncbi:MAG: 5'/3'-nucleotidase SurE [Holosporaceae bacterium]|jgi:5'-nucleotidase|nr:5'/3'-nucleotidase SurE [Holosporaceae bacterium]
MVNRTTSSVSRILITNDDGINSSGIKALERIANSITPDVWVIAPEIGQSGKGFSVTFDSILRINEISPRKFSISGTPADCVFIATEQILGDKKPDLILSGINHGANIADFIGMSGTVGAAFAASLQNIKSIAVSQHFINKIPTKFPLVDHFLPTIIKRLMSFQWPNGVCMNINFPNAPLGGVNGIRIANQGKLDIKWSIHKKEDPVSNPYYWIHATYDYNDKQINSDVLLVEKENYITITPLMSRHEFLECANKLEELFSSNV